MFIGYNSDSLKAGLLRIDAAPPSLGTVRGTDTNPPSLDEQNVTDYWQSLYSVYIVKNTIRNAFVVIWS